MNVRELSINAPRGQTLTVSVSTTSAQSSALAPGDYAFVCDQDCNITVGANPTATTSHWFIPAKTPLRIAGIQDQEKIAIRAAASGTAWIAAI